MNPMFVVHAFLLLVVGNLCVSAAPLEVFDPPVLTPNASTVWTVGQLANITWDTSSLPANLTTKGSAVLHKGDESVVGLDDDINLLTGFVVITVPSVPSGHDYFIVLFGDSGNTSPGEFTINNPVS